MLGRGVPSSPPCRRRIRRHRTEPLVPLPLPSPKIQALCCSCREPKLRAEKGERSHECQRTGTIVNGNARAWVRDRGRCVGAAFCTTPATGGIGPGGLCRVRTETTAEAASWDRSSGSQWQHCWSSCSCTWPSLCQRAGDRAVREGTPESPAAMVALCLGQR